MKKQTLTQTTLKPILAQFLDASHNGTTTAKIQDTWSGLSKSKVVSLVEFSNKVLKMSKFEAIYQVENNGISYRFMIEYKEGAITSSGRIA